MISEIQEYLLSTFTDSCNTTDIKSINILWNRHKSELKEFIDHKNVVDILAALSRDVEKNMEQKDLFEEFLFGYSEMFLNFGEQASQNQQNNEKSKSNSQLKIYKRQMQKSFITEIIPIKTNIASSICQWLMNFIRKSNK